jgi:hypothetical protein
MYHWDMIINQRSRLLLRFILSTNLLTKLALILLVLTVLFIYLASVLVVNPVHSISSNDTLIRTLEEKSNVPLGYDNQSKIKVVTSFYPIY